ncbi:uncharacterized protein LOC111896584 [Lactuca sativa]|uniref:uncharacterized protein LOC111896584 n=1 Tax=Lactuca sativa TaxID=4236 RepID=UPI0022B07C0D|nr:uncharacterized protein LOC111896584 [Lactuca sativa]
MGTTTRIPRLMSTEGFPEWKYRIEKYIKMKDFKIWRSILRGPVRVTMTVGGETLEAQLQRFTALTTDMNISGICLSKSEINKKLLNAIPRSWDMNVAREINHMNSYSTTNLVVSFNNTALSSFMTSSGQAFTAQQPQTQTLNAATSIPQHQPSSVPSQQTVSASNVSAKVSYSNTKESDENLALATGLVNCYNAFVAGDFPPQLSFADLDQIHPKDVEEMDITWQIAMAVFRAKQFAKKTGKNNWAMNADKKVGFNKSMLRCFNCHEPGHFAPDYPKPDRRVNNNRQMVAVGNNRVGATTNGEIAMVVQSFDWEDQIKALNITGSENTHLAQIDDAASKNNDTDPEAEMMELQFALMVSTSSEPKKSKVNLPSCSFACKEYVTLLRNEIQTLRRRVEDLKYEGYQLRKGQKPLKAQLEAKIKDFRKSQSEFSKKCEIYDYTKTQLDVVTKELDELKIKSGKTDVSFKNYYASSKIVESLYETQLKFKENQNKGLGYDCVPPPFNHYYTSIPLTQNETDREPHLRYGKPAGFVSRGFINIESTNFSTSSADTPLDQAKCEAGESVFVFNFDFSIVNKFECVSDDKTEKAPCVSSSLDNVEFNFFDMSDELFGNSDACDSHEESSTPQVKSNEAPSLVSQSNSHACSSKKSKSGQLWRNIVRPWYVDSGCSRHMTGDISQLSKIQSFNGGYVSLAGGDGGKITQRGTVTNGVLSFENVNFAPELKHSLLSVSQICDKGYSTHFTDKECMILKPGIVIPEEWILVKSKRAGNAYIIDMNNNLPEQVTCLFSKVFEHNAMLWHRRLGHANAKNLNRLAKNEMVRGLPVKIAEIIDIAIHQEYNIFL